MGRYGNVPVSYYSGSPSIEVPLHGIGGKYLSMPVSLSYDANAVKVAALPAWTGLGWTLQAGGVVTRAVQGNPDMDWNYYQWEWRPAYGADVVDVDMRLAGEGLPEGSLMNQKPIMEYNFLQEVVNKEIETQPDVYYFNMPGFSGSFVITREGRVIMRDYTDWTVEPLWANVPFPAHAPSNFLGGTHYDIVGFRFKDPLGNLYEFADAEFTFIINDAGMGSASSNVKNYLFNSSWHLMSMRSCDGSEGIDFENQSFGGKGPYTDRKSVV